MRSWRAAAASAGPGSTRTAGAVCAARSTSASVDPAQRAGACERGRVQLQFQRPLARRRGNARALAGGGRRQYRRCSRWRSEHRRRRRDRRYRWRCRSGGGHWCRRLRPGLGADQRKRRTDRKPFVAGLNQNFFEYAVDERLHIDVGLVGLDNGDDVAALDCSPGRFSHATTLPAVMSAPSRGMQEFRHGYQQARTALTWSPAAAMPPAPAAGA